MAEKEIITEEEQVIEEIEDAEEIEKAVEEVVAEEAVTAEIAEEATAAEEIEEAVEEEIAEESAEAELAEETGEEDSFEEEGGKSAGSRDRRSNRSRFNGNRRRSSEFDWESLDSVQNSRKSQLINEIYDLNGTDDAKIAQIKAEWDGLEGGNDDSKLDERYERAIDRYEHRFERMNEAKTIKESLIKQAEALKDSEQWKKTAEVLKGLQQQWREAGFAGEEVNDELWKQFTTVNDIFFHRRNKHYEDLGERREKAVELKTALVKDAQELSESTEWKETSKRMIELMDSWKAAGSAGHDKDDELWELFKTARQAFFKRQDAHFETMRETQKAAQKAKEELVAKAGELALNGNPHAVRDQMDELFDQWKQVGFSGRKHDDKLWEQFNTIRKDFFLRLKQNARNFREQQIDDLGAELDQLELQAKNLETMYATITARLEAAKNKPLPSEKNADYENLMAKHQEEIDELEKLAAEYDGKIEATQTALDKVHNEYSKL